MPLSERSENFLRKQERDWLWSSEKLLTKVYLSFQDIPLFEEIIHLQKKYSGYHLKRENKADKTFNFRLFSKTDILFNSTIDCKQIEDKYYFYCGYVESAPFNFLICENGNVCLDEEPIQIISSSLEKLIEQYALEDELKDWTELPYYFKLKREDLFAIYIKKQSNFRLIEECSDVYNEWWTSENITFTKGTWWGDEGFFIHIYGRSTLDADNFKIEFSERGIIN